MTQPSASELPQTAAGRVLCSNAANHADGPDGYMARFEWARRMNRTHRQRKCPGCGLWKVWEPR